MSKSTHYTFPISVNFNGGNEERLKDAILNHTKAVFLFDGDDFRGTGDEYHILYLTKTQFDKLNAALLHNSQKIELTMMNKQIMIQPQLQEGGG